MSRVRSVLAGVAAIVLALSGLSCGSSGPKLYPVRGTVHFEGQPAAGATVILEPVSGGAGEAKPSGVVSEDGTFKIVTHPHGDGAPAGDYAVLVTWFPPDARQTENAKNKLPARYADPAKTPLPRLTVQSGASEVPPIKLTAK